MIVFQSDHFPQTWTLSFPYSPKEIHQDSKTDSTSSIDQEHPFEKLIKKSTDSKVFEFCQESTQSCIPSSQIYQNYQTLGRFSLSHFLFQMLSDMYQHNLSLQSL